jgi:transcriptional regulator with XRE-family HTH domain
MTNNTLGSRISESRRKKGMTQEELAERMGVSAQAVSKWENDISCPDISLLPSLAKCLELTLDQLLTGKEEAPVVSIPPAEKRKKTEDMLLRIRVLSSDGDKINVNVPIPMAKAILEMGLQVKGKGGDILKNADLEQILQMAETGVVGKLVEVESAEGDTVEVFVE